MAVHFATAAVDVCASQVHSGGGVVADRFRESLSAAILISEKSLGNHPDNLDANALTCSCFEEVYTFILSSSRCTVVEQQFVWAMLQADSCGSRSVLCEEGLKWPTNGRTRGSSGSRAQDVPRLT